MTGVRARGPGGPLRMVFDGQSRLNYPTTPANSTFPHIVMRGLGIPWENVAVDGLEWDFLATDVDERGHPQMALADAVGVLLCGGEGGIGEGDTAAQGYIDLMDYANGYRTAGAAFVAATTMLGTATIFSGPEDTQRLAFNQTLKDDGVADGLDAVIDIDVAPLTWYPGNPLYLDTVHLNVPGAIECGRIVRADPDLKAFLGYAA